MTLPPSILRLSAVFLASASLTGAAQAAPMIVQDGKPKAQIVIAAENRPRMATLAALELQRYVEKISGARLPIVTSPDPKLPVKIFVGLSPATEKLGVNAEGLKYGAYRIASGADWIALVGDDEDNVPTKLTSLKRDDPAPIEEWKRITAGKTKGAWSPPGGQAFKNFWNPKDFNKILDEYYGEGASSLWTSGGNTSAGFWRGDVAGSVSAVVEFLNALGVRFYMPGELGEVIPKTASIAMPKIDGTYTPDFAARYWAWYNYGAFPFEEVMWARRLGINEGSGFYGVHGLPAIYHSAETKKAHPEFFALIGGQRDTEHRGEGTPCFSSEGLTQEAVNYCRFMYDEVGRNNVDLMPGDGLKPCQCDECKGKTMTDLVWGFVNRVATELYKTHPNNTVSCGAYTSYKQAPDSIEKFSPNVLVSIYNYGRAGFNDPDVWDFYQENIEKWNSKLAPGRIRRGENNLHNGSPSAARRQPISYPVIFPKAMAKDLTYLKGKSLGEGAEVPQIPGRWKAPGVDHLALFVQAQYLMDADQNIDEVLDEYYTLFYGPAASEMKEAFTYAEANIATKNQSKQSGGSPANAPLEAKLRVRELFEKARVKAGDTIYGERIAKIISELKPAEEVVKEEEAKKALQAERIKTAPVVVAVAGADLSKAKEYPMVNIQTGEAPKYPATFRAGWDKNDLIIEVTCQEPDMKNLAVFDPVYEGDYVAVGIETPLHTYYLLQIAPDGKMHQGNPAPGDWTSVADVQTERGEDFWRVKLRIPSVDADEAGADPNHRVAGLRPTAENPWYIMVGKARVRGGAVETIGFNKLAKGGWRSLLNYGKLVVE